MRKGLASIFVVVSVFTLAAPQTFANDDAATGVIRERVDLMKRFGKTMITLKHFISGQFTFDADRARHSFQEIQIGSGPGVTALFPVGSDVHPSGVLPTVWRDWDRFSALFQKMERTATDVLAEKPLTRTSMAAGFRQIAGLCRSCHKDFRAEKR